MTMMRILPIACWPAIAVFCLLPSATAFCQSPSNGGFNNVESRPCPYHAETEVRWPVDWAIYQTTNGLWDGPIDSSRCISVEGGGFNPVIPLSQVDPGLPLFIRSTNINSSALQPNFTYLATSSVQPATGAILQTGNDCAGELCSGIKTIVNIPAEEPGERAARAYSGSLDSDPVFAYMEACITTERFESQFLEEFIIKFTFEPGADLAGEDISLFYSGVEPAWGGVDTFSTIVFPEWTNTGTVYEGHIIDVIPPQSFGAVYLGLYADTTYPGPQAISYIEAFPEEEAPLPQVLNLITDDFASLYFQPFTQLRGGLAAGSDSLRHEVNIISNGASYCIGSIIDLVFDGTVNFVYQGGQLNFNGPTSCLMFLNGSELRVGDGQSLHYGSDGEGILGLGLGSWLVLGKGSRMEVNNRVVLWNHELSPGNQAYVALGPGQELVFGPRSSLERIGFTEEGIRLNVYMNGGHLDDTHLSPAEQALIKRIYPPQGEPSPLQPVISPNPSGQVLSWSVHLPFPQEVRWEVCNLLGQPLLAGEEQGLPGRHTVATPLGLPAGSYVLTIASGGAIESLPFICQP